MHSNVPYTSFDTDMVSPGLRREAWIESMKPIYDVIPIGKNDTDFKASAKVWEAGGLFFGSTAHDAQIMDRRRNKHKQSGEPDYLLIKTYRKGAAKSIHNGNPVEHNPNDVHLLDFSHDYRSVTASSRTEWVLAPYKKIWYDPSAHATNSVFSADGPSGYVLSELLRIAFDKLPAASIKDAETIADMLTGTLRNLVGSGANSAEKKQAMLARRAVMQSYVIENIHDLSLDVATLCAKFGVSRATVFRDFEPGGLQNFMMVHRLDRALHDIASGPSIRGRIMLIAEKWGFSSPAHFSRAFRNNFGFSPSDVVGISRNNNYISGSEIGVNYNWTRGIKQSRRPQ